MLVMHVDGISKVCKQLPHAVEHIVNVFFRRYGSAKVKLTYKSIESFRWQSCKFA